MIENSGLQHFKAYQPFINEMMSPNFMAKGMPMREAEVSVTKSTFVYINSDSDSDFRTLFLRTYKNVVENTK